MAPDLILASTSAYRRALLERLGIPFNCVAPRVDENAAKRTITDPVALAEHLAVAKAEVVAKRFPEDVIIGGDQLATIDGDVLGKPGTPEAAIEQLSRLAGRTHELVTAICVIGPNGRRTHTDITRLTMRLLTCDELVRYVERDVPIDCAGSYKIESAGISLFERIDTADFTAITGLPMIALVTVLREFRIKVP